MAGRARCRLFGVLFPGFARRACRGRGGRTVVLSHRVRAESRFLRQRYPDSAKKKAKPNGGDETDNGAGDAPDGDDIANGQASDNATLPDEPTE